MLTKKSWKCSKSCRHFCGWL